MPLHEFACQKCKKVFEEFVKIQVEKGETTYLDIRGTERMKCPECGSEDLKKLVSSFHFQLKGGGWAKDGYSKV